MAGPGDRIRAAASSDEPDAPLEPANHIRRVMVGIRGFNGDPRDPEGLGRFKLWRQPPAQAARWFEETAAAFASVGVRRVVLINPAGKLPGDRMPPDPLGRMSPERQRHTAAAIARLKRQYPWLEIGLYCGSGIDRNPSTPEIKDEMIVPDFNNPEHRRRVLESFVLVPTMGFDFVMIDNISGEGGGHTPIPWLRYLEERLGIPTYGEAYPVTEDPSFPPGPGRRRIGPDRDRIDAWRWMALDRFVESRRITTPGGLEHYIGLNGNAEGWLESDANQRRIVADVIERGFVPLLYYNNPDSAHLARYAVEALARHDRRTPDATSQDTRSDP